ncbi:putative 50s ribosomal protein l17 protein [Lasiodiplodia theobromae]|uniref:50s ribosomal protein l17 n=1 Tax=Lasiodiplodia theobromae TaxID=45133 RepID=UPI0015C3E830|nr:50s ribosomal protein l17 [Lasiodiplodia theobromae]KAF4540277.1 50s ribosomal protein l17 [Lasiodiplodia theobromae]KAF9637092.1 putative 50s ribosomal protein l17 protein [Lasiodiplodia theobromae]
MAGGAAKYRHLSRKSSHRQALLRNLVTSLFEHESIQTTWHKAKEAQRIADKLITLGKKNTENSRRKATEVFYRPVELIPKLFGPLRERYADRPGGYTRVLRIEPLKEDQAASAILELVDSPKDIRFAMMAKVLARQRSENLPETPITRANLKKVMQFRGDKGKDQMEKMVEKFARLTAEGKEVKEVHQKKVYLDPLNPTKGKKGSPYKW